MQIFDLVFPKHCIGCSVEGTHCCEDCLSLLSIARTPSALPNNSNLSLLYCATSFEDPLIQRLIRAFKYPPFLRDLSTSLAYIIVSHFNLLNKPIYPPNIICPVPLYKKRLKWRGYNHAEELASQLSFALSLPLDTKSLQRVQQTVPQVDLDSKARLTNVKGAFTTKNSTTLLGKTVLLIDDVYTTGATMEECARVLKKAGVQQVLGAVVARG